MFRRFLAIAVVGIFALPAAWFMLPLFRSTDVQVIPPQVSVSPSPHALIRIGTTEVNVDVANVPQERMRGLSGRPSLSEQEGMLFLFPKKEQQIFWMKGMQFPIDILWIHDHRIVGIASHVPPEPGVSDEQLRRYTVAEPVDIVLEVSAGWAENHRIHVGDAIQIDFPSGEPPHIE